jgi:hypothetical protein
MAVLGDVSKLERENLEVHVDKCELRYIAVHDKLEDIDVQFQKIDNRFDRMDERLDRLETDFKKGHSSIVVALIGATATIIAAFVGVIILLQ